MTNPTSNFGWQMPTSTDLVTDLPADFEVFGQAVDTSLADLKGGTTGQVLKKNTNADMDFVWSADSAGMTNPMTTTGDTIYSSSGSTPARLGIGSTGQVLTVSGGVPTWAAAGAAATSYTLLNSGGTALTGAATITVSSLSGYNKLFITVEAGSAAAASNGFYIRLNSDTANYRDQYNFISAYAAYDAGNQGASQNTDKIWISQMANTAASVIRGSLLIDGANSSGIKIFTHWGGASQTSTQYNVVGGGVYTGTSVISSVTIFTDGASNFDNGTMYIYGAN